MYYYICHFFCESNGNNSNIPVHGCLFVRVCAFQESVQLQTPSFNVLYETTVYPEILAVFK